MTMTATISSPAKKGRQARVEAALPRMRALLAAFHREPSSDWGNRAVCHDADPELFAPIDRDGQGWHAQLAAETADRENHEQARTYCARCPVAGDCLAEGLTNNREGTWGGERLTAIDWEAGRLVKKEMDL